MLALDDVLTVLSGPSHPEIERDVLEQGTGLLLWVAEFRRELRPWLAVFYHAMAAQTCTLLSVSPETWGNIVQSLDANLVVQRVGPSMSGPLKLGWRVIAMGSRVFQSLDEVKEHRPPMRARSWIRVHDPRSKTVKLSSDMLPSVSLWREAIRLTPLAMTMRPSAINKFGAVADAWAAGDAGGIGGWWQTSTSESPASFGWFELQFKRSDFPSDFELPLDLNHCISSLELLAQLALLRGRNRLGYSSHKMALRQLSDNTPTEGAINKLFTTSKPMIWFLQPLIATAVSLGVELTVDHEPGHSNILADGVSRAKTEILSQFNPANRVKTDLLGLLRRGAHWTCYPPDASWPDHLQPGHNVRSNKSGGRTGLRSFDTPRASHPGSCHRAKVS